MDPEVVESYFSATLGAVEDEPESSGCPRFMQVSLHKKKQAFYLIMDPDWKFLLIKWIISYMYNMDNEVKKVTKIIGVFIVPTRLGIYVKKVT